MSSAPSTKRTLSAYAERVLSILTALSIVSLVLMMLISFVAVVMRYLFNLPILGVNEIVQLLAVSCVFMAMPYATASDAHVRVDIFDHLLGRIGCQLGDLFTYSCSILVLSIVVHKAYFKMLYAAEFEDATNMLNIPLWPFYGLIALGMALYVTVLAVKLWAVLFAGVSRDE